MCSSDLLVDRILHPAAPHPFEPTSIHVVLERVRQLAEAAKVDTECVHVMNVRGAYEHRPGAEALLQAAHENAIVDFEIVEAETIRAMLPGVALSSQTTGVAVPNLVVYPFSGSAFLSGDLTNTSVDEQSMRLVTRELYVHLRHNTFSYALANASDPSRSTICQEILDGIVSRLAGPGWNAQVAGLDAAGQITQIGRAHV